MHSRLKIVVGLLLSAAQVYTVSVPARAQHCTVLLDDALFVYGGYNGVALNDFYSLNISQPFDNVEANFQNLSSQAAQAGVLSDCAHVCFPGPDSQSFTLFGGNTNTSGWFSTPNPNVRLLWKYSDPNGNWSIPASPGSPSNTSTFVKWAGVAYDTGKTVYISGGWSQSGATGSLFKIDLPSMTWNIMTSSPLTILGHTLSLTSGGLLVSIGGASSTSLGYPANLVPMDTLYIYNTLSNLWTIQTTSSPNSAYPTPRYGHSTVITPDQRIVMYGGWTINSQPLGDVWVLNASSNSFAWNQPVAQISTPRADHTATLIGNHMVVLFGQDANYFLNDIQILDLNSYTWQSSFIPGGLQPSTTGNSLTGTTPSATGIVQSNGVPPDTSSLIIEIAVPIAVVLVCFLVAGLLLCKYKKFDFGPHTESENHNGIYYSLLLLRRMTTQKPNAVELKEVDPYVGMKPDQSEMHPNSVE